ncbi:nucleolar and coiled-body phosphoprotein 1-like isoform X2 [Daphnia pulex]|uniref:nucleolar and coiled-body phosphoprotein 1-like isoform X2 n=1 Tax=Daphnia pulex TaxID=6669 RepID=UPI001EDF729F|nr:nucleolar and coiled-body phosphoprotein 1-like isoform X2 [Daphnia pulex]
MSNMSNTRLSTASSYSKNKAKKDLHPFHDSSVSIKKEEIPLEMVNSKMISLDSAPKCLIQIQDTQSKKQRMSISGQENAVKMNKSGDWEHQLKGSFSRKTATTTRQTPVEKKKEVTTNFDSDDFFQEHESLSGKIDKKMKPPSARNTEKTTTQIPPSAKKRGTKNDESPSTETGDSPEPAAKRPIVASERKTISAEEPATSSTEHVDKENNTKNNPHGNKVSTIVDEVVEMDLSAGGSKSKPPKSADPILRENKGRSRGFGRPKRDVSAKCVPGTSSSSPTKSLDHHSRVGTKTPEAKNDEAHEMTLKTADKSKERKYRFLSSSESEVGDEEDDEDDNNFLSRQKTKSPKIAVPKPTFNTPATVVNKVSELGTPKTSKFRLLPEPVLPPRTPRRTLTLAKESSELSSLLAFKKRFKQQPLDLSAVFNVISCASSFLASGVLVSTLLYICLRTW